MCTYTLISSIKYSLIGIIKWCETWFWIYFKVSTTDKYMVDDCYLIITVTIYNLKGVVQACDARVWVIIQEFWVPTIYFASKIQRKWLKLFQLSLSYIIIWNMLRPVYYFFFVRNCGTFKSALLGLAQKQIQSHIYIL